MSIITEVGSFIFPMGIMAVIGTSLWAIGQLLRRKGYDRLLDSIDAQFRKYQKYLSRIVYSVAVILIGAGRSLNRMPFLGSQSGLKIWDKIGKDNSSVLSRYSKKQK